MENKIPGSNWWQVYLLLPLIVVLAWVDTRLNVGETEHKVFEIGAVLFVGWLANRSRISGERISNNASICWRSEASLWWSVNSIPTLYTTGELFSGYRDDGSRQCICGIRESIKFIFMSM